MKSAQTLVLALGLCVASAPLLAPREAAAQEAALPALRAQAQGRAPARLLELGRALRRAGHFDEAVATLRAAAHGPTQAEAQWELARVRLDQNDFRGAMAACNALPAGQNPRDPAGLPRHLCAARAHLVQRRVALAEREFAVARRVAPQDPELALATADALRMAGEQVHAEEAYRTAAGLLPGRAEPHLGLASLFELTQHPDEALAEYRRAVEVDAQDPAAQLALGRFLLRVRHDPAAALPALRAAAENRPAWPDALLALGNAQLASGATADALASFQEASRLAPTLPGVQSGLGRTFLQNNQLAEAEPALRLAIQQVPTDADAQTALAELLGRAGRGDDALEAWNRVIDLLPSDLVPRLRAAEQARGMGQLNLARAYLSRILSDDDHYAPALLLSADIAFDQNDRPGARQFYQAALDGHGEIDRARAAARIAELDAPARAPRRR